MCKHKSGRVLRNCLSQIESNDIEEERAENSFLITLPKNKEVLKAFYTCRRRLQCESADMDTFFRLEKLLQKSMENNIKQTTIEQYFT